MLDSLSNFLPKSAAMIKFPPLDSLGSYLHRILRKGKDAVYCLQISALVLEIFKFENWVKYANEMTDGIISSTKYCIKNIHVNSTILVNLLKKPLKLGRLIVLNATHLQLQQFLFPRQPTSFPAPSRLTSILNWF